jgi:hypothetical protein
VTSAIALAQQDLGGLGQLILLVVFLLVSGLARLFKHMQQQKLVVRDPRRASRPAEADETELSWEDLLRGRVAPRAAEPPRAPPAPQPSPRTTIEGHSAREVELAPRDALAELPAEADLESHGGDEARGEVEGVSSTVPLATLPATPVMDTARESGVRPLAAVGQVASRRRLAEWRQAIVTREVLGPAVGVREPGRDLLV